MADKMKVAVMEDIRQMKIREMGIPIPGPDEVLVKIYQCNICSADWQTWAGLRKTSGPRLPWASGHEMAGEIVKIGENVPPGLKIGSHAGIGSILSRGCGACYFCRRGNPTKCVHKHKGIANGGVGGSFGMAQYCAYDYSLIYPLSDDLSYEEGAFLEPVATCVHGIRRLRITPGEKVLVIGAGNLGLINAQIARVYGGDVLVSEISEVRRSIAESLGFQTVNPLEVHIKQSIIEFTDARGFDAVILAVANTEANNQAIQALAPLGRILFFAAGYPTPELNIDSNTIHYKEYELIGTYNADPWDFEKSAEFLSQGKVKVDKIISQKIPIDDVQHGFELAATPGTYRVSLSLW